MIAAFEEPAAQRIFQALNLSANGRLSDMKLISSSPITALSRHLIEGDQLPKIKIVFAHAARQLPVGRVGEAEDLAETYLYLMRQGFSTGAMILVEGGGLIV